MPPRTVVTAILLAATELGLVAAPADTRTISFHEGTQIVADLAPNGDQLAAVILGQVWTVNTRSHEARLLTDPLNNLLVYRSAVWSQDSERIVASGFDLSSLLRVDVIDAASGAVREILHGPLASDPEWTPGGSAILALFRKQRFQLCRVELETTGACTPVAEFDRPVGQIAFTADKTFVSYTSPGAGGKTELWERELATSKERKLLEQIRGDSHLAYSPDGTWIALQCGDPVPNVCLLDRRSGLLSPITHNVDDLYFERLSWTPNSREVIYTAAGKIHAVAVDGSASRLLEFTASLAVKQRMPIPRVTMTPPGQTKAVRGIVDPAISPDGRKIVVAALGDLWLVTTSTGAAARITNTMADESQPRWAPDDERLAYVRSRPGAEQELMLLRLADPIHPRVLRRIAPIDFAWSPDGRRIAYRDFRYRPGEGKQFFDKKLGWIDVQTGEDHTVAFFRDGFDSRLLGWSSDGLAIVYSTATVTPDSEGPNWSIRSVLASDGPSDGREQHLSVPGELGVNAAWSSKAERAAYSLNGLSFYARVDSPAQRIPVPDLGAHAFSWSSGGSLLLYQAGAELKLLDASSGRVLAIHPQLHYTTSRPSSATIIRNAHIVDGTGSASGINAGLWDILIRDGRIEKIERPGQIEARGALPVDVAGSVVMPGLFNLH